MEDVNELFSELGISLFRQPITTQDILTAEIQPHFSAQPSLYSCVELGLGLAACLTKPSRAALVAGEKHCPADTRETFPP